VRARPRIDDTQRDIIAALRAAGYLVQILASVGGGVPDLLVGCPWGELVLVEAKNRSGKGLKLTPAQEKWHAAWRRFPVFVAEDAFQALQLLQRRRDMLDRVGAV